MLSSVPPGMVELGPCHPLTALSLGQGGGANRSEILQVRFKFASNSLQAYCGALSPSAQGGETMAHAHDPQGPPWRLDLAHERLWQGAEVRHLRPKSF